MKLEAAHRLSTVLAQENTMSVDSIIRILSDQGIDAESPDDADNSVVAYSKLHEVTVAFAVARWNIGDRREVEGGLYCGGTAVTITKDGQELNLLHTAHKKVTIWLI